MKVFYAFWFIFCAGWGYLAATFPPEHFTPWWRAALMFPVALAMSLALLWWEVQKQPSGRVLPRPSLQLKPWNRPIGQFLFIGLTFAFSGFWGLVLSVSFELSSPGIALQFFAMGAGLAGGYICAWRLFPSKFDQNE